MAANKLGRMKSVQWDPPVLTFEIERHGALCRGGTRATRQQWRVDTSYWTATCHDVGHRQTVPMAKRFDARSMAEHIADKINTGSDDPFLRWKADRTRVHVVLSEAVGGGYNRTVEGRTRKLLAELRRLLEPLGWTYRTGNAFERTEAEPIGTPTPTEPVVDLK